ncbi:hypothetical protein T484DRAFT_2721509 [Baffinella frigidus]|nr:hypothetical protein T484DRAFT_2721509 [Cryptophyta sp. CCMP2293]
MFARRGLALLALLAHVQAFQHGAVLYRPQLKSSVSKAAVCSRNTRPVCVASRLCCQAGALEQDAATELSIVELERLFEERIAKVAPAILEMLNAGPGSMAVVDNLLGLDQTTEMRREAVAVTERGLLRGSASAYSTAPPETFEERYGDEPGISATVLTPGTVAGELSPRCGAYITAASRVLSRVLGGARRGTLEHAEDGVTDHQLRLTTVAQQAHMDNAFDGENRRLITTIYYLNPAWVSGTTSG